MNTEAESSSVLEPLKPKLQDTVQDIIYKNLRVSFSSSIYKFSKKSYYSYTHTYYETK